MYQINELKGMSMIAFIELLNKQTDKNKIKFLLKAYKEVNKEKLDYMCHI